MQEFVGSNVVSDAWDSLATTRSQMKEIDNAIPVFQYLNIMKRKMPIIETPSLQMLAPTNGGQHSQELSNYGVSIPGMKTFKEAVKRDLEGIEKVRDYVA